MAKELTSEQKLKIMRLRVLIVEDSAVDLLFLKTSLEKIGIQSIHEAVHGSDGAFKLLNARDMGLSFHLVLTDWKMPKKDGLAFLKQIRSEKFKTRPYVIMLTSHAETPAVREAKAAGIDDYIVKPFNLSVMTEKLIAALEKVTL